MFFPRRLELQVSRGLMQQASRSRALTASKTAVSSILFVRSA